MKNVSLEIIDLLIDLLIDLFGNMRSFWGAYYRKKKKNCVKIVLIWSYSDLYFPTFGLNAELCGVFSQNAGKYGPEKLRIRTLFTQ